MELLLKAGVLGLLATLIAVVLKKHNREMAMLLTLAACIFLGLILLQLVAPVVEFLKKLRNLAGLEKQLLEPMLKTVGIGLTTQICATVCCDAGEQAIGNLIELCGSVLAIYVALPLLEAVLDLVQTMAGG